MKVYFYCTGYVVGDVYGSVTLPDDFGSGSVGSSNSSGIGELTFLFLLSTLFTYAGIGFLVLLHFLNMFYHVLFAQLVPHSFPWWVS